MNAKHPLSGSDRGRKILRDLNISNKKEIESPKNTPPAAQNPTINSDNENRKVGRAPRWGQRS